MPPGEFLREVTSTRVARNRGKGIRARPEPVQTCAQVGSLTAPFPLTLTTDESPRGEADLDSLAGHEHSYPVHVSLEGQLDADQGVRIQQALAP